MMTCHGIELDSNMVLARIDGLVSQVYKILPLFETGERSVIQYMTSLQREMLGLGSLIAAFRDDDRYLCVLAILQRMIDCGLDGSQDIRTIKSDVFKAISILKKMKEHYDGTMEG